MKEIKFYTTNEVAKLFRLTTQAIRQTIERGEIKAVKIGSVYRIPEQEVKRLLQPIADLLEENEAPESPETIATAPEPVTPDTDEPITDNTTEKPSSLPEWDGISGIETKTE